MAHRKTLTEAQIGVLQWIADGSPPGVMPDLSHRISAAALRSRGLVKTAGRGATWAAQITAAGREYLDRAATPGAPQARQANVSVTKQLVDEIVAAGGTLRVPRKSWYDRDSIDYEHRARLAIRHRKVPPNKRLRIKTLRDEVELALVDNPHPPPELRPVVVPERIGRYHATARAFRRRTEHHAVSRSLLGRATRIIHVIAREAEHRGWAVSDGGERGQSDLRMTVRDHGQADRSHFAGA